MEPELPYNRDEARTLATLASTTPNFGLDIRQHMSLMQEYRAAVREIRTKLEILDEDSKVRLQRNPIHGITSRIKTPTSLIEKLRRKGLPMTVESIRANIYDIAGVRVVCNYLNDVEEVADALLAQDDVKLIERKDYINHPKESGYRSLHLVVSVPVYLSDKRREVPVEVQIRTIAMDFWASLEHRLRYKNRAVLEAHGPDVESIRKRLVICASQIALIDQSMQQIQLDIDALRAEQEEALFAEVESVCRAEDAASGPALAGAGETTEKPCIDGTAPRAELPAGQKS